jgi:hypothetical protein
VNHQSPIAWRRGALHRLLALAAAALLLAQSSRTANAGQMEGSSSGGRVALSSRSLSYEYGDRQQLTSGVDGDSQLVFVAEPLSQRIAVLDRFLGTEVAQVPAPPGGFLLPFSIRVPRAGHLVVLDSGGFPNPAVPSVARVYDYSYGWNGLTRSFTASLTRSVSFA